LNSFQLSKTIHFRKQNLFSIQRPPREFQILINKGGIQNMSSNKSLAPTSPLTPSELVLLNGEHFAKKVMLGNIKLLHTDASVSISQLAQAILAAAVLADEFSENLRLEVRQEKAMFGLRKVRKLYANPTPHPVEWPQYSLESQLPQIAERFKNDDDSHQVSNLIYAWLRQDSSSPWQSTIEMVKSGLADRSLLEKTEQTELRIFTVVNYRTHYNFVS